MDGSYKHYYVKKKKVTKHYIQRSYKGQNQAKPNYTNFLRLFG